MTYDLWRLAVGGWLVTAVPPHSHTPTLSHPHTLTLVLCLSSKHFLQILLLEFNKHRLTIWRCVGLQTAEEAFGEGTHFSFGEYSTRLDGLLPCQRSDHFFLE